MDEVRINEKLKIIAEAVANLDEKDKNGRKAKLRESIPILNKELTRPVTVSLDSRTQFSEFISEECKVLDSKKAPIWVVCKNPAESFNKIDIIFKVS